MGDRWGALGTVPSGEPYGGPGDVYCGGPDCGPDGGTSLLMLD